MILNDDDWSEFPNGPRPVEENSKVFVAGMAVALVGSTDKMALSRQTWFDSSHIGRRRSLCGTGLKGGAC